MSKSLLILHFLTGFGRPIPHFRCRFTIHTTLSNAQAAAVIPVILHYFVLLWWAASAVLAIESVLLSY